MATADTKHEQLVATLHNELALARRQQDTLVEEATDKTAQLAVNMQQRARDTLTIKQLEVDIAESRQRRNQTGTGNLLSMRTALIATGCGYLRMSNQLVDAARTPRSSRDGAGKKRHKKWALQYFEVRGQQLLWADNRRMLDTQNHSFSLAAVELRILRQKRDKSNGADAVRPRFALAASSSRSSRTFIELEVDCATGSEEAALEVSAWASMLTSAIEQASRAADSIPLPGAPLSSSAAAGEATALHTDTTGESGYSVKALLGDVLGHLEGPVGGVHQLAFTEPGPLGVMLFENEQGRVQVTSSSAHVPHKNHGSLPGLLLKGVVLPGGERHDLVGCSLSEASQLLASTATRPLALLLALDEPATVPPRGDGSSWHSPIKRVQEGVPHLSPVQYTSRGKRGSVKTRNPMQAGAMIDDIS